MKIKYSGIFLAGLLVNLVASNLYSSAGAAQKIEHSSLTQKLSDATKRNIIQHGIEAATLRISTQAAQAGAQLGARQNRASLSTQAKEHLLRFFIYGIGYKILNAITADDFALPKRIFLYDKERMHKKDELLKAQHIRAIHAHNTKIFQDHLKTAAENPTVKGQLEKLIIDEIQKEINAHAHEQKLAQEYAALKSKAQQKLGVAAQK